jgi:hypothetical protein
MRTLDIQAFYLASVRLQRLRVALDGIPNKKSTQEVFDSKSRDEALGLLEIFIKQLTILEASVTLKSAKRLKSLLANDEATPQLLTKRLADLDERLSDELPSTKVLVVDAKTREYFDPKPPLFGDEVRGKFSSAVDEIDEAGNCYALGRPTAAVFHLMRVMETGIKAAAKSLGLPDPIKPNDRTWGAILGTIKTEIDRRSKPAAVPPVWLRSNDAAFFWEVHASLDSVKMAWRNTTMHLEKKYDDDAAESILLAVAAFMTKLASRMDENGVPLA